jgi:hypothetical protein
MKVNPFGDDEQPEIVNVFDFYKSHGLSDMTATQLTLHMLLTRTLGFESEARECALELNIALPFIFPDDGNLH